MGAESVDEHVCTTLDLLEKAFRCSVDLGWYTPKKTTHYYNVRSDLERRR